MRRVPRSAAPCATSFARWLLQWSFQAPYSIVPTVNDIDSKALAALLAQNRELAASLEMTQRLVALLLADTAKQYPNPEEFIFFHVERIRAAINVSDDPDKRVPWQDMEDALDRIADFARVWLP